MTKKYNVTFILLFILVNFAFSQEIKTDNILGSNYKIYSEVIGAQQQLQVYVPESYTKNSTLKYPVLYLLDGQNWFDYSVSLHKVFTGAENNFKSMPDFIVVGVTTTWKNRRDFFNSSNTKNAINFIENEVIAFIDENFRTSNERLLFGWQFAGGFVMNTLSEKPELFNGYLAATPVFFDPNKMDSLLSENENVNTFLYIGGTNEEKQTWVQPTIDILTEKAPKTFDWNYKEISAFGAFGHRISPVETISYGLRAYFYDYPPLEFKNVNDFYEKGGINYVQEYYEKRAKRYNISKEMGQWDKYILVRLALRENHFSTFDLLMNEFKKSDFVNNLQDWQIYDCANLYLNNNKHQEAIELYNIIVKNNPENAQAHNALGNAYLKKGNRKNAIESYKDAIKFAKSNNDKNIDKYQSDLDKIEE